MSVRSRHSYLHFFGQCLSSGWLVHSGSLMATGSADASMKVLGVGKVSQFARGLSKSTTVSCSVLSEFDTRAMLDAELLAEWPIVG
jgi:hypothetical protein